MSSPTLPPTSKSPLPPSLPTYLPTYSSSFASSLPTLPTYLPTKPLLSLSLPTYRWNLYVLFTVASALGGVACISSLLMLYVALDSW